MPRLQAALILFWPLLAADFSGQRAFEQVRKAVEMGPRPSGSAAIQKLQTHIHTELRGCRCEVTDDDFVGHTPDGDVPMKNILARFAGSGDGVVVVSGHYDTKRMAGFLGANDGGSSTGVLLELARVLAGAQRKSTVIVVWLDGEEAVRTWSDADSLYGSRHLAARWQSEGVIPQIRALVNVDMIGDKQLDILEEGNSNPSLRNKIWAIAAELGYSRSFLNTGSPMDDDHLPFLERGVPAVDLIDFNYGPANRYWHSTEDTLDKLSPGSLEVVGRVLVELLRRI